MQLIPSRDLRVRPAEVWKTLKQRKEVVITNNGKPVAVMTAVDAERVDYLVTGNKRHFPAALCRGITVVSPSEFISQLSNSVRTINIFCRLPMTENVD